MAKEETDGIVVELIVIIQTVIALQEVIQLVMVGIGEYLLEFLKSSVSLNSWNRGWGFNLDLGSSSNVAQVNSSSWSLINWSWSFVNWSWGLIYWSLFGLDFLRDLLDVTLYLLSSLLDMVSNGHACSGTVSSGRAEDSIGEEFNHVLWLDYMWLSISSASSVLHSSASIVSHDFIHFLPSASEGKVSVGIVSESDHWVVSVNSLLTLGAEIKVLLEERMESDSNNRIGSAPVTSDTMMNGLAGVLLNLWRRSRIGERLSELLLNLGLNELLDLLSHVSG